ncbi:MAG: hypothetical protein PHU21_00760 [Elusimicrobia bacterium]|nr:hypothetical protein [Elusimicrobiota bacterium]
MKLVLAALLLCLPGSVRAGLPAVDWEKLGLQAPPQPGPVAGRPVLPLKGLLSVWSQVCAPDCGLPSAIVKNEPVALELPLPEGPGQFRVVRLQREYQVAGKTLRVKADFYALRPPAAAPYFSVQVELSGAAAALCTASLNEADFSPFPVLACGAPSGGRRLGVSLHRANLP